MATRSGRRPANISIDVSPRVRADRSHCRERSTSLSSEEVGMSRLRAPEFLSRVLMVAGLCTFGVAPTTQAQGTITGRVVVQGTTQPLADARVLALGTNSSGTSAEDGKYTLSNVRSGTVDVQVLRMGYTAVKKTVTVTAGATTTADFELAVSVVRLQDVVSTATGQQRRIELGNNIVAVPDVSGRVE